ncbi:MAG: thiamine phosphate synthase [Clostridia bacterium]|nr:thiamine phosphate synthase [Clostridia bacterium]MBR1704166.1 thiamine phosphate synthase [Clostridia bacterium]
MQNLQNVICITDRHLCRKPFPEQMRIVAAHQPAAIVLRELDVMEDAYRTLVERVRPVCEEFGVPLIVHTFYETALALGIPKVKLHLEDLRTLPEDVRKQFEVIGTTVHSVEEAREAVSLGATFLTASLAAGNRDKYGEGNHLLDFLKEVSSAVDVPVYAMGGASREDLDSCLASGAAGLCMMSRLMTLDEGE